MLVCVQLPRSRGPVDMVPWFQARPRLTVAVVVLLYLGIFVIRVLTGTPRDATNMLYALPIALAALAFGRRAGAAAGCGAVLLVVAWVVIDSVDLTVWGWTSRIVPMLLLGVLLGQASDRLRLADERSRRLETAAQRHQDAVEINDTLVQGMVAAKWSLESGRADDGLRTLNDTITVGHHLVSELMRDTDMGPAGQRGAPTREQQGCCGGGGRESNPPDRAARPRRL